MEIGYQRIHNLEPVSRIDKNVRVALSSPNVSMGVGGVFQSPGSGGAEGDHPPLTILPFSNRSGRIIGDAVLFTVHAVFMDLLNTDRKKGAQTDMQGKRRYLHPSGHKFVKEPIGEMQSGRRRGNSSGDTGEYCLVARTVRRDNRSPYIRREGDGALFLQPPVEFLAGREGESPGFLAAFFQNPRRHAFG